MREARGSSSFKYTTWILAMQCSWTLMSIRMNHPFHGGKSLPARQEDSKLQAHWYLLFIKQIDFDSWIIHITSASIVTKDSLFMLKRPVSIIMILRMDNSSISCSFATKYFLCAAVKKNMLFWREILFHQSSYRCLTYSYLTIFHKMVTKGITCTNLSIFQFECLYYSIWMNLIN